MKFEKNKGERMKKNYFGFCHIYSDINEALWWDYQNKEWTTISEGAKCNFRDCKTIRAFRRMLRKAPRGYTFELYSNYAGHNVRGKS